MINLEVEGSRKTKDWRWPQSTLGLGGVHCIKICGLTDHTATGTLN